MPDRRVSERVYQDIRRRLLNGAFQLRERLDVGRLADSLKTSATPVREALLRLASERLIASVPGRGFFMAFWNEAELRTLYQWRGVLAKLALEEGGRGQRLSDARLPYPDRAVLLFSSLARAANPELKRVAGNADDRLHAARWAETDVFDDLVDEYAALKKALMGKSGETGLVALNAYHQRRVAATRVIRERALIRAASRNGG
jgi:DNA-binding GntR family transcriptional regulator